MVDDFYFSNIAPDTPMENYFAALQAVTIYGAPGADENTPYVEPEFISFEEFLKNKVKNNAEGYTFRWLEKSAYKNRIQ